MQLKRTILSTCNQFDLLSVWDCELNLCHITSAIIWTYKLFLTCVVHVFANIGQEVKTFCLSYSVCVGTWSAKFTSLNWCPMTAMSISLLSPLRSTNNWHGSRKGPLWIPFLNTQVGHNLHPTHTTNREGISTV